MRAGRSAPSPGRHRDVYRDTTRLIWHATAQRLALPASALVGILLGTSVYLLDRDWATVLFLAPVAASQGDQANLFGPLGQVLPSFCHAYAFALLLILALGRTRRARLLGALTWFAIAAGLEALQMERLSVLLLRSTAPYPDSPVIGSAFNFVVNGRFDPGDLLATGLGCLVACLVVSATEELPCVPSN